MTGTAGRAAEIQAGWRAPNAAYFVAARREPSGITVGKPGGSRRSANKNAPKSAPSKWHLASAPRGSVRAQAFQQGRDWVS
jgi:hypothetical protein